MASELMRPHTASQQRGGSLPMTIQAPAASSLLGMRSGKLSAGAVINSPAMEQLKRTADKLVADQQNNKQDIATYKQKLREEHERCRQLTTEKARVNAENTKLQSKIKDDQKQTEMMLEKMERVQDAQKLLCQHNAQLARDVSAAGKLHGELQAGFQLRFTDYEAMAIKTEGLATIITDLKQQLSQGREELASLATEKEGLQQELHRLKAAMVDRNASYQAKLAEQAKELAAKTDEVRELLAALEKLSEEAKERNHALHSLQVTAVEAEATYKKELSQFTAAVEAERARAQGLAADLTAARTKHAGDSQEMKLQAAAITERDIALAQGNQEIAKQAEVLVELTIQRDNVQAALNQLRSEHNVVQLAAAAGQAATGQLSAERDQLASQLEALMSQKASLGMALEAKGLEAEESARQLLAAAKSADDSKANAEKQLAELEAKLASHGIEAASLKAAADAELKQAHVAADAKIQTYNQRTNEMIKKAREKAEEDTQKLKLKHAEDVTEAAKREASLEVALKKKGTAAAGGAAALASAQQKHAASLKLIHANHAATLKTMQEEAAAGQQELKAAAAEKLKAAEDALEAAAEERDAAHELAGRLKREAAVAAEAAQALQATHKEEAAAALQAAVVAAASEAVEMRAAAAADKETTTLQLKRVSQELEKEAARVEQQREALQEAEAMLESAVHAQSDLKAELEAAKESATEQAFLLRQISVAADTNRGPPKTPRRVAVEGGQDQHDQERRSPRGSSPPPSHRRRHRRAMDEPHSQQEGGREDEPRSSKELMPPPHPRAQQRPPPPASSPRLADKRAASARPPVSARFSRMSQMEAGTPAVSDGEEDQEAPRAMPKRRPARSSGRKQARSGSYRELSDSDASHGQEAGEGHQLDSQELPRPAKKRKGSTPRIQGTVARSKAAAQPPVQRSLQRLAPKVVASTGRKSIFSSMSIHTAGENSAEEEEGGNSGYQGRERNAPTSTRKANPHQNMHGRKQDHLPIDAKQANRNVNRKPPPLTGQPPRNQHRKQGPSQDLGAGQALGIGAFWGDIDVYEFDG